MTRVIRATRQDLERRRAEILDRLGLTYDELAAKATAYSLTGDEWYAWREIGEIDFLLAANAD
jgi:hypothetical protein